MSVLEYIILSFALTVPVMVTLRACALKNPIRLTRGLGVSFLVSIVHVLLILAGIYIGNLLRFELPEYDSLIYLGLLVVVALRMFFPAFRKKEKELRAEEKDRSAGGRRTGRGFGSCDGKNCEGFRTGTETRDGRNARTAE